MFAVVEITGVQFNVRPGEKIRVPLLNGNPGDKVTFDKVLVAGNDEKTNTGAPYIGGQVEGTILGHIKDDKVWVFKKKRRKGYRKLNGHRQQYSNIEISAMNIDGFDAFGQTAKPAKKKAAKKQTQDEEI